MAFSRFAYLASTALVAVATPALAQEAPAPTSSTAEDDTITVTGIRKSIADSIATKRRADSIVDVISAEDVGKLPDSNIADSLARLPGVTVDRQFGEGEQLSIAGTEPALNRVTIDGHSVASADWGGNPSDRSSRSFNYSLLSPTIISQAVLYKTPEARLQEGAIGGTVDIVTRKPLELKSNTIAATAGGEYNDRAKRGSFRGSALYSWKNQDETIGFLGSVSYDKEQLSRAGVASYWYRTGAALLESFSTTNADGSRNPIQYGADGRAVMGATINGSRPTAATISAFSASRYASFLAREFFKQERERISFSGAVSAKPTDNLTVTGTGLIIRGNYDNVSNSEYTYGFEGSRMTAATFVPGQNGQPGIVDSATFTGITSGTGSTGQLDTYYRRTRLKNDSVSLLVDWTPGEWTINGNLGATRATGGKDPEYLLDFRTQQGFTAGANGRNTQVNWNSPASDATKWLSNFTANGGENITAPDGRRFFGRQIGGIPLQSGFTTDSEIFGEVNVKRDVDFGPLKAILFGGRYASHLNGNTTYSNAVYTNQNYTLADLDFYVQDKNLYNGLGTSGNGTPYATLDKDGILSALTKYGNFTADRGLSRGDYWRVREKIAAGYIQANFELGKFRGNLGGRVVNTSDASTFYVQSTVNGSSQFALTKVNNDETRFLPAANVIFQAGEDVVLRASAAKVIARPRYGDLAGSLSLDDTTRSGSGGNPDLRPYAATNYGLSAEWYFAPASFLSGEFFYRDISNYVGNQVDDGVEFTNSVTGRTLTYSISRPINGGKASVTGMSLSGNTNIAYGFGVQGSYTFADAETPFANGLPFLSRHTFTIVPYYEEGPFQARVSYNRRSKYFYRFGRQASSDYTDRYRQLDAQISYAISEGIGLTAAASNLLDETYYQYSSTPDAPTSIYKNGRVFSLSATFRM
ncbi:TonB-dependent receptor [Sphingomonas sp. Leaf67]|uniref:TonB-dependent receptor n=1 Tax=unclassified Sphingomonas TaxID=196159 RepID=UPI0006F4A1D5|nr:MULTISPECIES: TonB-dependent receptor [unclassified Sphingomonas]KQN71378.1 TonB-dependent receptor [Sphingomonas sp. Leaf62]KQN81478.1 TonB-dependent receptor [Sphingomonas sp. Leaf67]